MYQIIMLYTLNTMLCVNYILIKLEKTFSLADKYEYKIKWLDIWNTQESTSLSTKIPLYLSRKFVSFDSQRT